MNRANRARVLARLVTPVVLLAAADVVLAQAGGGPPSAPPGETRSFLDIIRAGGLVSYAILLLSVVGVGLVVDCFLHIRADRIVPPLLVEQLDQVARQGKFSEVSRIARTSGTALGRIVAAGFERGNLGLPAIREAIEQAGTKESTSLTQRVNYVGFISAVAPMLGLLGTVTGMIHSFNILGAAKGAARPEQLATGVTEALVNTAEGLIVAVPMMFLHAFFRDRVTRISQEMAAGCERLLRSMTVVVEARAIQQKATVSEPAAKATA